MRVHINGYKIIYFLNVTDDYHIKKINTLYDNDGMIRNQAYRFNQRAADRRK